MYQPHHFQEESKDKAFDFIEKFPFATLMSQEPFSGSHLPIKTDPSKTRLLTHVAAKNDLAQLKDGANVLAIFQGPHAYVSPKHYTREQSVPTWNYIAVHVLGRVIYSDPSRSEQILMDLVDFMEPDYRRKWQNMPSDYKAGLLNQMRPLEIEIITVEMTRKLSQNKSKGDRQKISDYLLSTNDTNAHELAMEMKREN